METRMKIIRRAVKEIKDGMYVNLGIGMPTLIANEFPSDYNVFYSRKMACLALVRIQRKVKWMPT